MKLFTALAALTLIAAPNANALPIWAKTVATSHCEYLAMGAAFDEALQQSIRDNDHWLADMNAAGSLKGRAINAAIQNKCNDLNIRALSELSL